MQICALDTGSNSEGSVCCACAANLTPCVNYTTISDSYRVMSYTASNSYCDTSLTRTKWYRLTLSNSNAVLPTWCPAIGSNNNICGNVGQMWYRGTVLSYLQAHSTVRKCIV